jgi:hypothetical protein
MVEMKEILGGRPPKHEHTFPASASVGTVVKCPTPACGKMYMLKTYTQYNEEYNAWGKIDLAEYEAEIRKREEL